MAITNKAEYDAAAVRANALSEAPQGTPEASELAGLIEAMRAWDQEREGTESHGPESVDGLKRPDDWTVSGLPGNLGKLHKD